MIYGRDRAALPNPITTLLHPRVPPPTEPLDSLFFSRSSPSFLGSKSIVSFKDANGSKISKRPFFRSFEDDKNVDEEYDEYFHQSEKKRRLTVDQVQFLEKSFEIDNKLEPERKVQLAKDLGLQSRQVAIWFQNRRARGKSKQLEKDYDVLQSSYNNLKADYEDLLKEKERLNAEVLHLSGKLLLQPKENTGSDQLNTDRSPKSPLQGPNDESASEDEASKNPAENYKQEVISSVKSDVLNSDSPLYIIDGGYSSLLEAGDMSYVLEPDQSDLSQDEEDNLNVSTLAPSPYVFPRIEYDGYPDQPTYSCYYEFPVEDQALEFWPY